VLSNDAEAQYGAGVYIYTTLFQRGGGPEKSTHDPRPDPNKPKEVKTHPGFGPGDIVSQQRVDLADTGIKYLEKAIALRPTYSEAYTYINLLYRQKSYAYFEYPEDWQKCVDNAVKNARKSFEANGRKVPQSILDATAAIAKREAEAGSGDDKAKAGKPSKAKGKKARKGKRGAKRS
jgi:hypothetical protein